MLTISIRRQTSEEVKNATFFTEAVQFNKQLKSDNRCDSHALQQIKVLLDSFCHELSKIMLTISIRQQTR
jgi:hypothetical protein